MAKKPKKTETQKSSSLVPEPKVKEIETEVDVLMLRLFCADCNVQMEPLATVKLSQPPMYTYQCPVCKHRQVSRNAYPMVVYKEKQSE